MAQYISTKEKAEADNLRFEQRINKFLTTWAHRNEDKTILRFNLPFEEYVANNAMRDFFMHTRCPFQKLLKMRFISTHLGRDIANVHFDDVSGDPLLAPAEQRIYNLARRMDSERMHIPFRSIHPNKQTEAGDIADISTYPEGSALRYNSGNHFASRAANGNVFDENAKRCKAKSGGRLYVLYKRGFLEDRLQEIKVITATARDAGEHEPLFFVICSRHAPKEGHFGVSLVIMSPSSPEIPMRILVCDTLLKELPKHPRWWGHFVSEFTGAFGSGVAEMLEDISHPLQKVNIKGDDPYWHDWDCPYYTASMTEALAEIVTNEPNLAIQGKLCDIHNAMKDKMPEYYIARQIKDRQGIKVANRIKRWMSGHQVTQELVAETRHKPSTRYS